MSTRNTLSLTIEAKIQAAQAIKLTHDLLSAEPARSASADRNSALYTSVR
jgi:hypothetical protein